MSISPKNNLSGKDTKIECMIIYPKEKEIQPVVKGEISHQMPTIDPKVYSNDVTLDGDVLSNGVITKNVDSSRVEKYKASLKENGKINAASDKKTRNSNSLKLEEK